jgi:hypothetical protein
MQFSFLAAHSFFTLDENFVANFACYYAMAWEAADKYSPTYPEKMRT